MRDLKRLLASLFFLYSLVVFSNNSSKIKPTNQTASTYTNFKLFINNNQRDTSTLIFYAANRTRGFDNGADSKLFGGATISFGVYTQHILEESDRKNDKLAIQTLPDNDYENLVIPVGIIATLNETITVTTIAENFPENINIFLEDKHEGIFTNLSETSYTFKHTGEEIGRFYIHTTYKVPNSYTWSGATNNNWHVASNWNENNIPPTNANVTIPSTSINNYPTLSESVTINILTMDPSSTLITNGFDVTGTLIYKNLLATNWHLIAPPVSNETIDNFIISNNNFATNDTGNIGLGIYNNDLTSPWVFKTPTATGVLNSGSGISIKLDSPDYISFKGNINTTDINYTITNGIFDNYNLIGNPFTAYINANRFLTTNANALSEQTIWLWNGTKYEVYNATSHLEIAPTQGFFIATNTAGSVTFEVANQSHQTTNTFKKEEPYNHFELCVKKETEVSTTKLFFIDGKSKAFDNGYDSSMFGSTNYDFAVYTGLPIENEEKKLAIQTLPDTFDAVIPVGVIAKTGDTLVFSIENLSLPEDIDVYLEDKATATFTNLSKTTYKTTFSTNTDGSGQFFIHTAISKTLTNEEIINNSNINVYTPSVNEVTITGLYTHADMILYSLLGKQVYNTSIAGNGSNTINLPSVNTGVYIVKLSSGNVTVTQKITLN